MTTRTQDIASAIVSALTGAGLSARMTTADPYSFETFPMTVVDVQGESPEGVLGGTGGYIYWNLDVVLYVAALGASPKLAPEPTRGTAHAALYADRTFGGLAVDITAGTVNRRIDTENPACGIAECRYSIKYRITEGSI